MLNWHGVYTDWCMLGPDLLPLREKLPNLLVTFGSCLAVM